MNERDLLNLKTRIEQAKSKVSELKGRKNYLMQELQEKWSCTTIQQAEVKIKEMKEAINSLDIKIKEGMAKLQRELGES